MCGEGLAMINRILQETLNICGPAELEVAAVCGEDWRGEGLIKNSKKKNNTKLLK